ncbi:MAG: replication initiator protein A [Gemmatimonadaceae bacterium]|jgi:plasmid replication initiation protein|nr:replication initiator protein A [Gemmatimonadaceae bacterium]
MTAPARKRQSTRGIVLDRSLEALPLFRLSDSSDDAPITYLTESGGRWRVIPSPGDRLPGTFDQDVYVELLHRFHEAGAPTDGVITFTLHAFLRSMGRRVDGRTYEQLRSALSRLERTTLESTGAYQLADDRWLDGQFSLLSAVVVQRRRNAEREQLHLFSNLHASEPGDARVTLSPVLRANMAGRLAVTLNPARYHALSSPVARRLYRLLEVARADGRVSWRIPLERLAEQLPLTQRYPSHLQRVLQPAHEMLVSAGIVRDATISQQQRTWQVDYVLAGRARDE